MVRDDSRLVGDRRGSLVPAVVRIAALLGICAGLCAPRAEAGTDPGAAPASAVADARGPEADGVGCVERKGTCSVEAERPSRRDDAEWVVRERQVGFSGGGYLQAHREAHPALDLLLEGHPLRALARAWRLRGDPSGWRAALARVAWDATRGVAYEAELAGGRYQLWLHLLAPARFGCGLGSERSDAVWASVAGAPPVLVDMGEQSAAPATPDTWVWLRAGPPRELARGLHELELRVAERGVAIDALFVSADLLLAPGEASERVRIE